MKMHETNAPKDAIKRRVANAYEMLKQALLDDIYEHRDETGLVLNHDLAVEVSDDLSYALTVFKHDILPAFGIKTDKKGHITNDDDI